MRKTIFIALLFASLGCTGCFTMSWNVTIDSKLRASLQPRTFSLDPGSFGLDDRGRFPEYKRCHYKGEEARDSLNYHHYLCPNMYAGAEDALLELFIPFQQNDNRENRPAIVKSVHDRESSGNEVDRDKKVYIKFSSYASPPRLDPNFIRYSVDLSSGTRPYTADVPSLISLGFDAERDEIRIQVGQRLDPKSLTPNELIAMVSRANSYNFVCPGEPFERPYIRNDLTHRSQCELWYWPAPLKASGSIETNGKTLWKITRYAGYIVTVPADIVTSPIQLLLYGLLKAALGNKPINIGG